MANHPDYRERAEERVKQRLEEEMALYEELVNKPGELTREEEFFIASYEIGIGKGNIEMQEEIFPEVFHEGEDSLDEEVEELLYMRMLLKPKAISSGDSDNH